MVLLGAFFMCRASIGHLVYFEGFPVFYGYFVAGVRDSFASGGVFYPVEEAPV